MNKFFQKTIGQWKIWTVIASAVLLVGLVLGILFGFNLAPTADSTKTITVRLDSYASNAVVEKVESICETEINKVGAYEYVVKAEVSGGSVHEYVYTFNKNADGAKLESAKNAINAAFATEKGTADSPLYNAFVQAGYNENAASKTLAKGFVWRAIVAGVAVLAALFVYCAFRLKWHLAITVVASTLVGVLLTMATIAIVRIPVTASVVYSFAFAALYTSACAILFAGNVKSAFKQDENKGKDAKEVILSATPISAILLFAAAIAISFVLIGAIAVTPVSWIAISALVALVCGTFTSLFLLPAVYVPVRKAVDKLAAARARCDYKKGVKTSKKEEETEKEVE